MEDGDFLRVDKGIDIEKDVNLICYTIKLFIGQTLKGNNEGTISKYIETSYTNCMQRPIHHQHVGL